MLLLDEIPHVARRDFAEEFDIIIGMKLCHFAFRRGLGALKKRFEKYNHHRSVRSQAPRQQRREQRVASLTYEYFHPLVQPVVHNQRMAHANPSRLHAVAETSTCFMIMSLSSGEKGGHTDVRGHSEIPQRQSRRNSTACVGKRWGMREQIPQGGTKKKRTAHTTRFFFSPSISDNSPGMGNEL